MRPRTAKRIPADAEKLVALSLALFASGSRVEDRYWENRIDALLARLLRSGNQTVLDAALDHLQQQHAPAYGALADLAETQSESLILTHDDQQWDTVLVAAPILAWTRFLIPSGPLKADATEAIAQQFTAHLAARNTRTTVVPYLFSIDQLPRDHAQAHKLTQQVSQATLLGTELRLNLGDLPESAPILADPRFVLAIIAAPVGEPLFHWQETTEASDEARKGPHIDRQTCLTQWREHASLTFAQIFAGCEFECLLPDAYHSACRDADEKIRPHTVRTAVRYLEDTLQTPANELRAVIAGFGEEHIDEYRIGFTKRAQNAVLYGVVWPLYGRENGEDGQADEVMAADAAAPDEDPLESIVALLRENGVTDIRRLQERFDPEHCDDCSVPLYADPLGDIVHAEMPDDAAPAHPHFH